MPIRCPRALALASCLLPLAAFAAAPPPHVDLHGDPLPPGAVARLGSARFRIGERLYCLAVSPDGRTLATAGPRGGQVWDAATGRRLRSLVAPPTEGYFIAVRFSGDGRRVLAVTSTGSFVAWEADSSRVARSTSLGQALPAGVSWSADGRRLLASSGAVARVWDVGNGRRLQELKAAAADGDVMCAALSPDGARAALLRRGPRSPAKGAALPPCTLHLVDAGSGRVLARVALPGSEHYHALRFSPDGRHLVGLNTARMHVHDAENGKWLRVIPSDGEAFRWHVVAPGGRRAAVLQGRPDNPLRSHFVLWDLEKGKSIRPLGEGDEFLDASFSPDGRTLFAPARRGVVRGWDVGTGKENVPGGSLAAAVEGLYWTDGGRVLLTASADDRVRVWDARTGRLRRTLGPFPGLRRVRATTDGRLAVVWTTGKRDASQKKEEEGARLIELASGRERPLPAEVRKGWPVLSPDGRWLASPEPRAPRLRLWDVAAGRWAPRLETTQEVDGPVVFSPDGRYLAAVLAGGQVCLWDLGLGVPRLLHVDRTAADAALPPTFSPDSRTLLYQKGTRLVTLCETSSGQVRGRLRQEDLNAGHGDVWAGWLVAGWPRPNRAAVLTWPGHGARPVASPDGRRLAAPAADGNVLVWDLTRLVPPRPIKERRLDPPEVQQCWQRLSSPRADDAFVAIERLADNPGPAVALLAARLKPPPPPDERRLAALVADLDAGEFDARRRAEDDLRRLGPDAVAALQRALAKKPSLHQQRAIERLLRGVEMTPERIQLGRALEVLERCGTPPARELLGRLAQQDSATWFRDEVKAALARWPR